MQLCKILIISVLACLLMCNAANAGALESAYDRVLRTGTVTCGYAPWPMYWDLDPNTKKLSGLDKELSDATFKLLGLKVNYVEVQLSNKISDLRSGKVDAICGDGPWILTSIKYIDYSTPFMYAPIYLYARADEKHYHSLADLNKPSVRFVGIDGDLSTELTQSNFPHATLNTLGQMTDASQLLLDVSTHKADVTILDPAAATSFITHNSGKVKSLFASKPLAVYNKSFSVKKGEVDLLNMLNGVVAALHNTGVVDPILDKYDPQGEKFLRVHPGFISK